jgi:molybdate transport system permease protein
MDAQTILLTLRLAATVTALLLVICLPLAWWLARNPSWLKRALEAIVALPLVLPPTVLGFYLLIMLGPASAPGRLITRIFGHPLAFTFTGLVIGSMIYSLPFAAQPLINGFAAVPNDVIETAATLGANKWRTFTRVIAPATSASILSAAVLTFAHTVGEFGVVLMIGGNIPGSTRTLSIALYDQVQDFNYAAANRTALMLIVIAFAAIVMLYARPGRRIVA